MSSLGAGQWGFVIGAAPPGATMGGSTSGLKAVKWQLVCAQTGAVFKRKVRVGEGVAEA
ncbi:hypothetical protein HBI56_104160 [Parastagonospora nodorum]|uniref:Uncharacterized protein n=1 Tax=Phaeosphaeria nodorum (strain SN15 / ATCC MYA-4574 / FGSC 10173) TaxID=321614 RepID=A0A7U2I7N7_PHANO|nr:hypothetical protein HBH56_134750 [Parastagonospora nodorum]QRD02643.1 hypothetical protein JI435_418320 [Parastagonospora nodorum SN15]KAH3926977.1 hypothetical protein HBH54_158540 [Parastagonospora nodorum]KAH3949408.1 hypothetical protein HBH53_089810 [Parastagonospora nodorum]KAH3958810.1 hypothetical protein HBH51_204960 [Parastagonospora nodorum]